MFQASGTRRSPQAKPQITIPFWMSPHWPPFCPQMFCGRHVHLGVPEQDAGSGAQNGAGGVHGGGTQPVRLGVPGHNDWVHPDGHCPPSGRGSQTAFPPPQPGCTQTSLVVQLRPPHPAPPPLPPAPELPPAPVVPPTPPLAPAPVPPELEAPAPPRPPPSSPPVDDDPQDTTSPSVNNTKVART